MTVKVCSTSDLVVIAINCCTFPKDSYRCYRDQNSEIEQVELIYSFKVNEPNAMMDMYSTPGERGGKKKYIKLKVYRDRIEQTISNEKLEFEDGANIKPANMMGGQTETLQIALALYLQLKSSTTWTAQVSQLVTVSSIGLLTRSCTTMSWYEISVRTSSSSATPHWSLVAPDTI